MQMLEGKNYVFQNEPTGQQKSHKKKEQGVQKLGKNMNKEAMLYAIKNCNMIPV